MAKRAKDLARLSGLEQEIMSVVWDLGECTSAEVIDAYNRKRWLAKTTIRTVLANLRKKGYLRPVPSVERGFRLRPAVTREAVARRSLSDLVSGLFAGSPRQAISHLLKDEAIAESDLAEIRKMLDDQQAKRRTKKRGDKT